MHGTIARLRDAMNAHDPDALAALFGEEYRSEQPAHPNRGFGGKDRQRDQDRQHRLAPIPAIVVTDRGRERGPGRLSVPPGPGLPPLWRGAFSFITYLTITSSSRDSVSGA